MLSVKLASGYEFAVDTVGVNYHTAQPNADIFISRQQPLTEPSIREKITAESVKAFTVLSNGKEVDAFDGLTLVSFNEQIMEQARTVSIQLQGGGVQ